MVSATATVVCGFCGTTFDEDRGQPTCKNCPLSRGCANIRCPHCGFENPIAPAWVQKLRQWVAHHESN
ncbi:MAG TPA: hypothetical protein VK864_09455 [Longimicrobiales bacterium]|nr:hypothetical protein [Longimicrobiales bacterium]